ncbi:unnamed protein product [Blepharisma stoltei]|uniref:Uncharacterized protein n=1 Tax=Blepharisma stoltei TaxID=1481888 RepID=A0AAU9JGL3_9CILI|nr:unnamed protein product [Blepharisma stoltei]
MLIWAKLKIEQGEREEVDKYLNQIEKIYKIDKILMGTPGKIQPKHDEILRWIDFVNVLLRIRDLIKAEKILKYIEEIFKTNFLSSWSLKRELYLLLGLL